MNILNGKVSALGDCGCTVTGDGTIQNPIRIAYCVSHQAGHKLDPHLRWDDPTRRHAKYRLALFKAGGEEIPHDEPVFIVRARDPLAAPIVRQYADLVRPVVGEQMADELLDLAWAMTTYDGKRLPNGPRGEGGDNG